MGAGSVTIQKMKADFPLLYGIWENPHHYYLYGKIKLSIAMTREEEIGPRSGRAGPSFSARPEKEAKGAVLHGTSAAAKIPSRATQ